MLEKFARYWYHNLAKLHSMQAMSWFNYICSYQIYM